MAIEESTFAKQLERASLLGRSFRPCKRCGGRRAPWRLGTGFIPLDSTVSYREALRRYQQREAKLAGLAIAQGFNVARLQALGIEVISQRRANELFPELPPLKCRECSTCNGLGIVDRALRSGGPATARPTGSSKHGSAGPSVTLDETALERHGRVSRRLKAVRARLPLSEDVLRAYYEPGGSYAAVWVFTEAGQKMLADNPRKLHPEQLFDNLREQEQGIHDFGRKTLLDAAQRQAIELVKACGRQWNVVVRRELVDSALRGIYGSTVRMQSAGIVEQNYGKLTAVARNEIIALVRHEEERRRDFEKKRREARKQGGGAA